jgi:hypothetical protein
MRSISLWCLAACVAAVSACEVDTSDVGFQAPPPGAPGLLLAGTVVRGQPVWVTIRGVAPFATIDLAGGFGIGDGICPTPVGSVCLDIVGARLLASGAADADGVFRGQIPIPAGISQDQIVLQAVINRGPGASVTNPVERPVRSRQPPPVQLCSTLPYDDAYVLDGATIVGDALVVDLSHGGGCAVHEYTACWNGSFMESLPEQVMLRVVHEDNGDPCDAWITRQVAFDLSPIREAAASAPILVQGVGSTLTYGF